MGERVTLRWIMPENTRALGEGCRALVRDAGRSCAGPVPTPLHSRATSACILLEELRKSSATTLLSAVRECAFLSRDRIRGRGTLPWGAMTPAPANEGAQRASPPGPDVGNLAAHGETSRARRRLNERYLAELAASLPLPRTELPLLFSPRFGPAELGQLTELVERGG